MNRFSPGPRALRLRSVAVMSALLFIGLWAPGAAAQTAPPAPTPPLEGPPAARPPPLFLITSPPSPPSAVDPHDAALDSQLADARAVRGAKRMETAGMVLSLLGAGGMLAGGVMIGTADTRGDFGGFNVFPGVVLVGLSLTLVATGIPLWVVGAKRSSSAVFAAAPASLRVGSNGAGVWVSGSF
jgi:hypothetical protein